MFGHGDFPQVNAGLSEPPGTQVFDLWGDDMNRSLELHFFLPPPFIVCKAIYFSSHRRLWTGI